MKMLVSVLSTWCRHQLLSTQVMHCKGCAGMCGSSASFPHMRLSFPRVSPIPPFLCHLLALLSSSLVFVSVKRCHEQFLRVGACLVYVAT